MGKMSRTKGAVGEREVVKVCHTLGLRARRTAPLQAGGQGADVTIEEAPELHIEVKRDQRMSVDAMVRQAEAEKRDGQVPLVTYRRNGEPWRAVVPLDYLLKLLARG